MIAGYDREHATVVVAGLLAADAPPKTEQIDFGLLCRILFSCLICPWVRGRITVLKTETVQAPAAHCASWSEPF